MKCKKIKAPQGELKKICEELGMRGKMGLGSNRINRFTIRMAASGMAHYLGKGARVAIAYDTRNNSQAFAQETARVLAAAGLQVYLFEDYSPVPLLSYAIRKLGIPADKAETYWMDGNEIYIADIKNNAVRLL